MQGRRHVPVQPGLLPGTVCLSWVKRYPLTCPFGCDWQISLHGLTLSEQRKSNLVCHPAKRIVKQCSATKIARASVTVTWPEYAQGLLTTRLAVETPLPTLPLTAAIIQELHLEYTGWKWRTTRKAPLTAREEHGGHISRGFEGVVRASQASIRFHDLHWHPTGYR